MRPGQAGVPTAHACAVGWRSVTWAGILPCEVFSRLSRATRRSHNASTLTDALARLPPLATAR